MSSFGIAITALEDENKNFVYNVEFEFPFWLQLLFWTFMASLGMFFYVFIRVAISVINYS